MMKQNKILRWMTHCPTVPGWYWILRGDWKKTNLMYLDTTVRGGAPDDVIAFAGPVIPPPIDPIGLYTNNDDDSKREEDEARTEHHEQGDR